MKVMDLSKEDIVIFKRYCDIVEEETYQDGNIIGIREDINKVSVLWLEGWNSRIDDINFDKVVARHNPNGEVMKFGIYTGRSELIES